MAQALIDPELLRLWRLIEVCQVKTVHRLLAREARAHPSVLGLHQHAVPTVVGCLQGVVRLSWHGGQRDLTPGELVVVAPAAWHVHEPLRPGSACWAQGLVFDASDVLLLTVERHWSVYLPAGLPAHLLQALLIESDPERRRGLGSDLMQECTSSRSLLREVPPAAWRMAQRMWSGLHRPLTAQEVLAASGLGERQAHRLFVASFGLPPKAVIRNQQLALAAELLREGESVTAVALACGFPDRRTFTRAWRNAHGHPPKDNLQGHVVVNGTVPDR